MGELFRPDIPPIPAIPPPPTRNAEEVEAAARKERLRASLESGRESTILGGSTAGTQPFRNTLLGA